MSVRFFVEGWTSTLARGSSVVNTNYYKAESCDAYPAADISRSHLLRFCDAIETILHLPTGVGPGVADFREEDQLSQLAKRDWPIVLHPDAINDVDLWRGFGSLLCIENMDKRKPIGRTTLELRQIFSEFPDACFCLDLAHARQVDSSMTETYLLQRILEVVYYSCI